MTNRHYMGSTTYTLLLYTYIIFLLHKLLCASTCSLVSTIFGTPLKISSVYVKFYVPGLHVIYNKHKYLHYSKQIYTVHIA